MMQYTGTQYLKFSFFSPKAVIVACLFLPFAATVNAQQGSVAEAIEQCSSEKSSLKRLVCFDRLAKSMRQYSGLEQSVTTALPPVPSSRPQTRSRADLPVPSASPSIPSTSSETVAPTGEQAFGLEHRQDTDAMISKLYASVTKVAKSARGMSIITIDNGQVWRQNDGSALKIKQGYSVYIERGLLGAFYLGKDGLNRRMKVKRAE